MFKAEVVITRTARQNEANGNGYFDTPAEVIKTELLAVTLSADEIENLKAKIHAHVGLVGIGE